MAGLSVSRNVLVLSGWVLICACPLITLAQTTKPAPPPPPARYNPPPAPVQRSAPAAPVQRSAPPPRYNPPPSNPAPRSNPTQNNQAPQRSNPPSSYTPNRQTPTPATRQNPPAASSGTTYRPRPAGSSGSSGSAGTTPRAPVTYTPGASRATGSSSGVSHTTGGATVYTPRAPVTRAPTPTYTSRTSIARPQPVYNLPASSVASRTPNGSSSLNAAGSHSVVAQLNSTRAGMSGVNKRPLPSGNVTVHGNGNVTVQAANGAKYGVRQNGTLSSYSAAGRSVSFAPNGRVQSVHTASLDIRRGVHGERTVVTRRPDHSVLVSTGAHRGYLERTVVSGSRTYTARTYYAGGRSYSRLYRNYAFGGAMLPYYVPGVFYSPDFYGWAFYPWASPIAYSWGWGGAPWLNAYNGYFSPSPFYPSGFAWLTDYYLSRTMAGAYDDQAQPGDDGGQAQQDDAGAYPASADNSLAAPEDTPITPDLKALITDEMHRQLAYENAIASGTAQPAVAELPSALKPDRIFVVSSNLDVSTGDDQACTLSAGDVLQLATPPGDSNPLAGLRVAASRRADCPAGIQVNLSTQDLADMQNNLRAQMDAGLDAMHTGQGQRGLPPAPASAMAQAPQTVALDVPLPPDPNVGALLDAQQAEARQTEADSVRTVTAALR